MTPAKNPTGRIRVTTRRLASGSRRAAGILTRSETRSLKKSLLMAALAVVILGVLITSIANYFFATRTPAEAVEKHLNHLEKGSYFWAIDRSAYSNDSVVFLKNSIYRKSNHRIENYSIESVAESGDTAVVQVRITVDGEERTERINLVQDHKAGVFNDSWRLAEPEQKLLSVRSDFYIDNISINGSTVKLKENAAQQGDQEGMEFLSWEIALLPGGFSFDMPEDSYYFLVDGPQEVTLGLNDSELEPLNYKLRPSYRMWSETDQKIDAWVKDCMSSRSTAPQGCPAAVEGEIEGADDVHWELKERPLMVLEQDQQAPNTWHTSKYKPAQFTVTYTQDGREFKENISANIDATVVSSGSDATIEVKASQPEKNPSSPSAKATDTGK